MNEHIIDMINVASCKFEVYYLKIVPLNSYQADDFARNGFQVYVPDYLNGDPIPTDAFTTPGVGSRFYSLKTILIAIPLVRYWKMVREPWYR